jgi:hypothetical protein
MTQFTTRVELHDATWSDYETLHVAMRANGFRQTITADDGSLYELPPAEYDYEGNVTSSDVLAKAAEAANVTRKSFAVLVTESVGRRWRGLKLLRKAA